MIDSGLTWKASHPGHTFDVFQALVLKRERVKQEPRGSKTIWKSWRVVQGTRFLDVVMAGSAGQRAHNPVFICHPLAVAAFTSSWQFYVSQR